MIYKLFYFCILKMCLHSIKYVYVTLKFNGMLFMSNYPLINLNITLNLGQK